MFLDIVYFCYELYPMSTREQQLSALLDSVSRLLDSFALLKKDRESLQQKLDDAQAALERAKQEGSQSHNLSTPTPDEPALSAAELDALVEEIDSCIALLKS